MNSFASLLSEVRSCTLCAPAMPHDPRPVLQLHPRARILVAAQAPRRRVHVSGVPFDDASGRRLRSWMGIGRQVFYDPKRIAILPMSFCYPGSAASGDLPPRPECAPAWRGKLLGGLARLEFTLLVGRYAHAYHLGPPHAAVTEAVRSWRSYWPRAVPLPHPSPRNNGWLRRHPWFEAEVLPALRRRVAEVLAP